MANDLNSSWSLAWAIIPIEVWHTLYMVLLSGFFSLCFGLPLGIILTITSKGHLKEKKRLYSILSALVNVGRSFPFIILMVALIPFTRFLLGTSLGNTAAIVPLTIAAIPFIARLIEEALRAVSAELIEAAEVMGATCWQIVYKLLLPEAFPAIILAVTTTLIQLVGASAMAGAMGAGGLGKVAIQYGYQRFNVLIMIVTIALLIALVQIIQWLGMKSAQAIKHKRRKN